jgi:hypothetical protein
VNAKTKQLLFILPILALASCQHQKFIHNPRQAASDVKPFLKALYFDENFPMALELADERLRQSATADDMRKISTQIKQTKGKLKLLRADSYLMTPGPTMELFYIGEYENGLLYHRLVLMGDASSVYKVSGVWFQHNPYPENALRRKFVGNAETLQ